MPNNFSASSSPAGGGADSQASDSVLIQLEGVTKQYGDKWAVRGLDLKLRAGEVYAFLGPNGAGKTTTIKMITGLLRPTAGVIRVAGFDLLTQGDLARKHLSYVPDQPHLYDKLSGRDFLRFTREIHGLLQSDLAGREEELIDLFELGDFVDDLTETYSHGMRQRLVFAAALLHRPKALVVDEPMVGLDPRSARIVKDLLRSIASAGASVLLCTHTLAIVEEIADRIGILSYGKLIREGTLAQLREESGAQMSLEDYFLRVTEIERASRTLAPTRR